MAVRLIDIAHALDLDLSTVSRALRDDPRVNAATRERVHRTAEEKSYRPNQMARRLARGKTDTIWCVLPGLNSPIDREPAQYAADALFDEGYDLMVVQHRNLALPAQRIFRRLAEGLADGALILPGTVSNPPLEEPLLRMGFPMVFIDRYPENLISSPNVVTTDNRTAAADLCRQLVSAGAESVLVGFGEGNSVEAERRNGAIAWLEANHIPWVSEHPAHGACFGIAATGQEKILSVLPDIRCPCIAGVFDSWVGRINPFQKVYICKQDFKTMAHEAVQILLDQINGKAGAPVVQRIPAAIEVAGE